MLKILKFALFVCIILAQKVFAQTDSGFAVEYFKTLPNLHIRALEAVSESRVWFAANNGVWGYTENGGSSWHIDSIKADTVYPQFRSIAVINDSTVLLLSVASPAYLFKTTNKGSTWRLVYKNTNKDIFFDSMIFYDTADGVSIGDPIDGSFQLLKTNDAGETWKRINCRVIPPALPGEACFASSNSNIAVYSNHLWFATGGVHTRVFHSSDMGDSFESYNTPLPQGEQMTGIFSIDFFDNSTGVIAGGNYVKSDSSITSIALTYDGGKTWSPIKNRMACFGSCAKFRTSDEFFVTGMNGTYKYSIKRGKATEVKDKSGSPLKYNTLRLSPSRKSLWLAGDKGSIAVIHLTN